MNTYIVTAEPKSQSGLVDQIQFLHVDTGYKNCWIAARTACRLGHPVKLPDNTDYTLPAGKYTVRKIFVVDTPKLKTLPLTADQLVAAAAAEHVKIPAKLVELIDRLKSAS